MTLLPRTETYPSTLRGTYYGGTDQITAIRLHGTETEFSLLPGQAAFSLGRAPHCDLRADVRYLATVHVRLERIANSEWLRATDVSSGKNPVIFKGRQEQEFYLRPGDTFRIGDTAFYALSEEMRLSRSTTTQVLGARRYAEIDDVLIGAALDADRHIVILAEPGSDQERLGQAIHTASLRRRARFLTIRPEPRTGSIELQTVRNARDGTLLVWLPIKRRVDPAVLPSLLAPEARVRLILCAPTLGKLAASFPPVVVGGALEVAIAPLRERKDEIPSLLDYSFVSCRSSLRFASFTEPVQQKLRAYRWKGNLEELRAAADYLIQLSHFRSERQATLDTDTTRGESRSWRKRLRLPLPLIANSRHKT